MCKKLFLYSNYSSSYEHLTQTNIKKSILYTTSLTITSFDKNLVKTRTVGHSHARRMEFYWVEINLELRGLLINIEMYATSYQICDKHLVEKF